jgi:hypothetical protein
MAAPEPLILRTFAGGELAPALAARADLAKYQTGLRRCRNFIVQRHGGVANRPGTRFIGACKTGDFDIILVRYTSEIVDESVLIEFGEEYMRFWFQGALVELAGVAAYNGALDYEIGDVVSSGGVNYYCRKTAPSGSPAPPNATFWYAMPGDILEIPHDFFDPRETNWVQSGRVITFTHPSVPPADLVFFELTRWAMVTLATQPKVQPPQNLVFAAPPAAGARSFGYVVTAAAPDSFEESEQSNQLINAACADPTPAAPHRLAWDPTLTPPVSGDPSPEYYVYADPYANGTYGFIGTATDQATFNNPGLTPDFSITPPLQREAFAAVDEYPSCCAYHQQRRYFGNTNANPDAVYASRVGFPDNFGISSPLQDDDAITFRIAGNNHHAVRHMLALKNLLILTDGGEWRLLGAGGVITPNSIELDQETYVGIAPHVRPIVSGNSVIYAQARESKIHDLSFDQDVEGLAGRDLTVFSSHLFDGRLIRCLDYAQAPESIVWVIRSDGQLLGLTYLKEQDIWGWHRHDTIDGDFEYVCTVPEPGEDAVYFIVERDNGRFIEKLAPRAIVNFNEDAFFVDSGLSYSGPAVNGVSGLDHLNGATVRICADGTDRGTAVVAGGSVIFTGAAATDVHVGLPITAEIESLDLDFSGGNIRDKQKRVQGATVIVDSSSHGFLAGPTSTQLKRVLESQFANAGSSYSGQIEINFSARWDKPGRVFIRQDQALPLTVLSILPLVELGG